MRLFLLPLLALGGTAAGYAQTMPATPAKPAAAAAAPKTGPDRIVCKTEDSLGSRVQGRRTCRTAREWGLINNDARMDMDRRMPNTGPQ